MSKFQRLVDIGKSEKEIMKFAKRWDAVNEAKYFFKK